MLLFHSEVVVAAGAFPLPNEGAVDALLDPPLKAGNVGREVAVLPELGVGLGALDGGFPKDGEKVDVDTDFAAGGGLNGFDALVEGAGLVGLATSAAFFPAGSAPAGGSAGFEVVFEAAAPATGLLAFFLPIWLLKERCGAQKNGIRYLSSPV